MRPKLPSFRVVWMWCVAGWLLGAGGMLRAEDWEEAKEGEELLRGGHQDKDPEKLEAGLRNSGTPRSLALAAAGNWLRYHKDLAQADLSPLTDLATGRGLRDEVALMLAFHDGLGKAKFQSLLERLMSDSNPEVRHLAAATLSTVHLFGFISDPDRYCSPQLDQRLVLQQARERESAFPEQTADMEIPPPPNAWSRGKQQVPALPMDWFTGGDRTLVTLAMVAAAFDGGTEYADAMRQLDGGLGTAAGARLLYLCRQDPPPSAEDITRMFTDAFRSPPSPRGIARPGAERPMADLYVAEVDGGVLACMALGALGDPAHRSLLLKALQVGELPVKMEALRALRRMEADDAVQAAFAQLLPDAPGMLLPDLCAAISVHPDERLIPPLLLRLKVETGRFRLDLAHALATLTGGVHGTNPQEWIAWWRDYRGRFVLNSEASEAFRLSRAPQTLPMPATGRFYGLSIYSDHLAYVVDTSLSMKGSRIESLRENLVSSLESFEYYRKARGGSPGDMWYNLIDFGGDVIQMEPATLVNDIRDGIRRAEEMPMTYGTRSFDALWVASRLPEVDTLYFLSDGAPVWGQVDKWEPMHSALLLMTWHRPLAVWAVAFQAGKSNAMDMRKLAYANFGLFEEL